MEISGTTFKSLHEVRSRHKVLGNVIYDAIYEVEIDEDLKNPDPDGVRICADTPVGRACIKLSDIIKVIGIVGGDGAEGAKSQKK